MLLRLLIVDNRVSAGVILRVLSESGFRVEARRADSKSTLLRAVTEPLDLVISNVSLPRLDILEVLAARNDAFPGVPVVVVTETGGEEIVVDCMKRGAADFLRFEMITRLPDIVKRVLERTNERGTARAGDATPPPGPEGDAPATSTPVGPHDPPARSSPTLDVVFRVRLEPVLSCDYVSPGIVTLTGYSPSEFYRDPYLFLRLAADEDAERAQAILFEGSRGHEPHTIVEWIGTSGASRWVDLGVEHTAAGAARGTVRDVSDLVRLEREMARQDALVGCVATIAGALEPTTWREALLGFLRDAGVAARASAFSLVSTETTAERSSVTPVCAWRRGRHAGDAAPPLGFEISGSFRSRLARGATVSGAIHTFGSIERAMLDAAGIRSVVMTPVFAQGSWWGTLILEDRRRSREWSAAETGALRSLADLLGGAIERDERGVEQQPARFLRAPRWNQPPVEHGDPRGSGQPSELAPPRPLEEDPELRSTVGTILDRMAATIGCDAATVLVSGANAGSLSAIASLGLLTSSGANEPVRLGHDLTGRLAKDRCRLHVPNLAAVSPTSPRAAALSSEGFQSYYAIPLVGAGSLKGVLEVLHANPHYPDAEWIALLEALAGRLVLAIEKSELIATLDQSNAEIQLAYDSTLEGWTRALDLRDRETEGHTRRVTEMTLALAEAMGDADVDFVHLRRGALLHDIGKMGIPDRILHKPGPLDESEWATMKLHPVFANEMLSPIDYLRPAVEIPFAHHERWDGQGYPRGLKGTEIPKAARIFAVADVWDALRSDRPYRKSWSEERTKSYIELNAEVHFDPRVVETFLSKDVYRMPLASR